ncbi:MAG: hypothetical protein ISS25_00105 [Nanoarchaeota archaeon]|nr:hypothetical protein [DPANN group archaeon]MBL7116221.1 hypothetical protein [Nanoarchaeota archaeon]
MIAEIKCPNCGFIKEVEVPKNQCIISYNCKNCDYLMKATNEKECCVICMFSDKKCGIKAEV